jgi:hypothetical protein
MLNFESGADNIVYLSEAGYSRLKLPDEPGRHLQLVGGGISTPRVTEKWNELLKRRGPTTANSAQPPAWVYEMLRLKNIMEDLLRAVTPKYIKEFTQHVDVDHPWLHKLPGVGSKLDKLGELLRSTSSLVGQIPDREYRALARARDKLLRQLVDLMAQAINNWQTILPPQKAVQTEMAPLGPSLPPGFDGFNNEA